MCSNCDKTMTKPLKHCLHQHHIQHGAHADAQKIILLPHMEQRRHRHRDPLRDPVGRFHHRRLPEAVDYQKPDHRRGQDPSQILDHRRDFLPLGKDQKGNHPGGKCCQRHRKDNKKGHPNTYRHSFVTCLSSLVLATNRTSMIRIMEGSTNPSAPNICRQRKAAATPTISGIRFF